MNKNDLDVQTAAAIAILAAKPPEKKNVCVTPCKDCVFAKYEGPTQIGCAFNRIEKFRRVGVDVVEAFDDDKEFFVIQTVCLAHRHKASPWAMRTVGRYRKETCRKELEAELEAVIVLDGDHTVEQVKATVDSLLAQTLLPMKVTVCVNRDGVEPQAVRSILPGDWIVQFIMLRMADGSRISAGRCVDHALIGSKSQYYATFVPGFVVPPTFFAEIDSAINDELERFLVLEPDTDGNGQVVQMRVHHHFGGNAEAEIQGDDAGEDAGKRADGIVDKVRHRVKVEDQPQFIRNVADVCPSMSRRTKS